MGGIGSGRRFQQGKNTTSDCRSLDVRWLNQQGILDKRYPQNITWSRGEQTVAAIQIIAQPDNVVLKYRHSRNDDKWQNHDYPVRLDWTSCRYGGQRAWFLCPALGCGRRVAVVYLGSCGIFACRHCYDLAYASQRESDTNRLTRRADKIRQKLKWEPGILNRNGLKPKGMHWKTLWKLKNEHDELVHQALQGIAKQLGIANRRLDKLTEKMDL